MGLLCHAELNWNQFAVMIPEGNGRKGLPTVVLRWEEVSHTFFLFLFFLRRSGDRFDLSQSTLCLFFFLIFQRFGISFAAVHSQSRALQVPTLGLHFFPPHILHISETCEKTIFRKRCNCLFMTADRQNKKKKKWIFKATVSCDVCFSSPNFHDDNSFRTIFLFSRFLRGIFSPTEVWILFSPRARCTQNRRAAESESVFQTVETQGETTVRNEKPKSWQAQQHLCVHWRCLCASVHLTACRHVWVLQKVSVYWCHIVTLLKYPRFKKNDLA